jgi:hypothetical protein
MDRANSERIKPQASEWIEPTFAQNKTYIMIYKIEILAVEFINIIWPGFVFFSQI